MWISIAVYLAVVVWIILKIASRRNWARIVYLCLALISDLDVAVGWKSHFAAFHGHFTGIALDIGSAVIEAVAVWLLFTKPANAWFKQIVEP